jgi:hypothetical protein
MEFNLVAPSDRRYRFRRKGLRDYLALAANRAADDVVMARRTGEITAKMNERGFPYLVDIRVPAGGLGRRVDAMYAATSALSRVVYSSLSGSGWSSRCAVAASARAVCSAARRISCRDVS